MPPLTIQCPACGAGVDVHNPGIVTIVCAYCGHAVYWDGAKVEAAGQQSILPEGITRLYRGACGVILGKRFSVMGRVRYSFGAGFWDEWFLEYDNGAIAWLSEDNFELALQERIAAAAPPDWAALRPGDHFAFQGTAFYLQEIGAASCLGMEGALPKKANTGDAYKYADAVSGDGKKVLGVEFAAAAPELFLGRFINHGDIALNFEALDWT